VSATSGVVPGAEDDGTVRYAGFDLRLAAGFADFIVFLPLIALAAWAKDSGLGVAFASSILSAIAGFAYTVIGHARWGQTLGKRAVGIRVIDVNGGPIGWSKALRRSSVDIAFGTLAQAVYWTVALNNAEFQTLPWSEMRARYEALRPPWGMWIDYVYNAWLASEFVTMLFNKQRRALHDFIGGTIVVVVEPQRRTAAASA
jgi:uncharacterized RDD family membrane protein YckC